MMRPYTNKKWTADDERVIVDMVEDGKRSTEIARVLGRSVHSVRARAERIGLRFRAVGQKKESIAQAGATSKKKETRAHMRPYDSGCMPDPLAWYYGQPAWRDEVSKSNR